MSVFKVGDKVRIVNKPVWVGVYEEGDTGVVVDRDGEGCPYTDSKYAANWSINDKFLRFHSRPVNS